MSDALIRAIEQQDKKELDAFRVGDTIRVSQKVKEGNKERIQRFDGIVLQQRGSGNSKTFTVRKIGANGIGVEKIYPFNCPSIADVKVLKRGKVRRAKIFYIRDIVGVVKIKERRTRRKV